MFKHMFILDAMFLMSALVTSRQFHAFVEEPLLLKCRNKTNYLSEPPDKHFRSKDSEREILLSFSFIIRSMFYASS